MKDYNNNKSPLESRDSFIWVAEYSGKDINNKNREYISELEFENKGFGYITHSFDEINKSLLSSLGFIGNGYKFFYDVNTGIFDIFGTKIRASYYDYNDKKEYELMNHTGKKYNDIILLKTVFKDLSRDKKVNNKPLQTLVYRVGYKTKTDILSIKNIFNISMRSKKINGKYEQELPYFKFRIVSSKSMHGEFRLYMNDELSMLMKTDLRANYGKTFKINIS